MEETKFYHALKIDNDRCVGCTHCMTKCPTGAIRIREGKASIRKGWCVDCGECLKACPTEAIYVEQDDFQKIFDYKARVVLVPTVFIGQFSKYTTEEDIFSALYELGFTHVFQVEFTADMIHREMLRQMELAEDKPVISSFCPAIVRLIEVRFPALVDNILLVKPPVNATATYYHKVLEEDGFSSEEIGIFYVTPCAAKIASLKGAEGYSSTIKGVINMDTLYNKVYHILKNRPKNYTPECVLPPSLTKNSMTLCISSIARQRPEKCLVSPPVWLQRISIRPLQPNPKLRYEGNIEEVLKKMEQVRKLMCYLPGIDCGACGSPNCQALAEDIVRHEAQFSDCVFMQRNMEKHGKLDKEHAFRLIEKTWGKDRLNKDCYKKGAKYEGQ